MSKGVLFFLILITFLSFTPFNNFKDLVNEKLNEYNLNYPEKIYVHTDKPYYTLGENIWFTSYLTNGITHTKSNKSKIVYADLVNKNDSVVAQRKLYVKDISVAGDFKIDIDWEYGNYILRAYTKYMSAKGADFYFQKEIPIWNLDKTQNIGKENLNSNHSKSNQINYRPDLNLYPESGYLVNGLTTKIAIKIKDLKSNIGFNGVIKDSENKIITDFKTSEFGLGLTYLKPEKNKSYYASIIINGKEEVYPLPKALKKGYNLEITNHKNQINLKAASNTEVGLKNSFLLVHQRGNIVFQKLETKTINEYFIKLNTTSIKSGVTHFTLFNNEGKPVCERLVFIDNPNESYKVDVNSSIINPTTREKNTLTIGIQDTEGNFANGNLSLSITDMNAVTQNSQNESIKTYLLLNSDLRGKIENPRYFFEKDNSLKRQHLLDLTMLTNGWSKFTWNDLLYSKNKQIEPEIGLFISGQTHDLKQKGKPISAATKLNIVENIIHQESKQSDLKGKFSYGPYVFYDSISVIIQARVKDFEREFTNNRNVKILLDKPTSFKPKVVRNNIIKSNHPDNTTIVNYINSAQKISDIDTEFLENARRLDEVLILAKKKSEAEERTELLNERTNNVTPTHRLDLNEVIGGESQSIIFLLNTLPGVTATNQGVSIRNNGQAGILLDGFPVTFDDISFMFGSDIEFIDVLSGANAGFYANAASGIISIYTKTGNFNFKNIKRKPGIINFKAVGFYTAREFYAPKHSNSYDEVKKQDIRTTLHWEPKITLTNKSKKAEVSFFTSDEASSYAIRIEGITDTGIPVYHLSTFEVD